jgi:glycosyltransferase involved in cell wall biosynthesis
MPIPRILHIDTGLQFRGGQRQLHLLSDRLRQIGIMQLVATPGGSEIMKRIKDISTLALSDHSLIRKLMPGLLKKAILSEEISVVHAHDSEAHTLGLVLKKWKPQLKLVVTRRVVFQPSGVVSRRLKYLGRVDKYIAISKAVAASLQKIGVAESKIEIIPSGLDIGSICGQTRDESVIADFDISSKRMIITAGAMTREKDFVTAFRAVSILSEKYPDVVLIVLGDGPERPGLERLIGDLKLDNIRLMGYHEPMAPIFKACDLFLLTSLSEGLNTSAIEAAACGLPLVVSDVGGLPEIAEQDYNGILCQPGDPKAFALAMEDLLNDESKRNRLSGNSIDKSRRFDIRETSQKIENIYKRLIDD